jgi:hypothetical protein
MCKSKISPIERHDVLLHGWDAQAELWHWPIPLVPDKRGTRSILAKLRTARSSFQGKLRCSVPGLPCLEFHTTVYDLGDTGVAIVHLDGSQGGPAGIVAVMPRGRREQLRNDFPFELMTLISFLGSPINRGCELTIHDYIEEALRLEPSATQVFAVETAELSSDTRIVVSEYFERLAAAMLDWMADREAEDAGEFENEECGRPMIIPNECRPLAISAACSAD